MKVLSFISLAIAALGVSVPASGGILYVCDASISSATCNYLNTTVAGYYSSTFINANATIYITMGTTDLGESTTGYQNPVLYSTYAAALAANPDKNSLDYSALAALNTYDGGPYGTGEVEITSALAGALGITSQFDGTPILGVQYSPSGDGGAGYACNSPGDGKAGSCYNGIITISNTQSLYYDNLGGVGTYDFYAVVQHETDEVLGTASCISTTSANLKDSCLFAGEPSAVDLFRYNSAGELALNSASCIGTPGCPSGAYFSDDGGVDNNADGYIYNTQANGDDYADFAVYSCSAPYAIQNGVDCGNDHGLTILNDGGAEINILAAVGFEQVPEPATFGLLGASLLFLALMRVRPCHK